MSDKFFITFVSSIVIIMLVGIMYAMYYDVTVATPRHNKWVDTCKENGGTPSKYQVTHGKTTDTEYLCIKSESIIEIE